MIKTQGRILWEVYQLKEAVDYQNKNKKERERKRKKEKERERKRKKEKESKDGWKKVLENDVSRTKKEMEQIQ